LKDGREIIDYESTPSITVDVHSEETTNFLQFILDYEMEKTEGGGYSSSVAARKYLDYGVVTYNNLGVLDAMLRRSAFRESNKLSRMDNHHDLMDQTISKNEFNRLNDLPVDQAQVSQLALAF